MRHLAKGAILDVRSPREYQKGHIPGAVNLPLFSDEERAAVGICYKQQGHQEAVALGLELVERKDLLSQAPEESCTLYCWRGGMRSQAVCHFFKAASLSPITLPGGYKAFRRWVWATLAAPRHLKILAGPTGAGKTENLKTLTDPILDLEGLANHRGSSFGAYVTPQPTQEQFENRLAWELTSLHGGPIWVEDESRMIGRLKIPDPLWNQMQASPVTLVECPLEARVRRLVAEYGQSPKTTLIEATSRLEKKLGSQRMRSAIAAIEAGDYPKAVREILPYYDKMYAKSLAHARAL